jgi:hypothetical protein
MGFDTVNKFNSSIIFFYFFSQEKARSALSTMHWNTGDALESLCKG